MEEQVRKFPMYLNLGTNIFSVMGELKAENQPFSNGKGYVYNDYVWIFSRTKPMNSKFPYFWYEHGNICFGKMRDSIKDDFHVSKLLDFSLANTVYKMDPNEELYDEEVISDMNAATSMFTPIINEGDDCQKVLIKMAILEKKVDINGKKSKMGKSYALSNLKTALNGTTKMSIPNFIIWCDLLGLGFRIQLFDNGLDTKTPLNGVLEYDSMTDTFEFNKGKTVDKK